MMLGQVYLWDRDPGFPIGGTLSLGQVPLPRRLSGRFVEVGGSCVTNGPGRDLVFDPEGGDSARFGAVNSYYHVDRLASYVDELLGELGAPGLPAVKVVVSAHAGETQAGKKPFQGGHYRLPGYGNLRPERGTIHPAGEIHLGYGWQLLNHGALSGLAGRPYRHNASHNAGILYHEYGHHISRHTADFQGNTARPSGLQDNRKNALDEGTADYWAATFLGSPHIWGWHRLHDRERVHRRSLLSTKTLADYDEAVAADPHSNGTIWAATLWDLRCRLRDPRVTDLLVLRSLQLWGLPDAGRAHRTTSAECAEGMRIAARFLLRADEELFASRHAAEIRNVVEDRGIRLAPDDQEALTLTA